MDDTNYAMKRMALKDLEPEMENVLIVGVIIGKQRPRKIVNKTKEADRNLTVWNFTLRDSPRDYINVAYWGCSDEVSIANEKFYTGDVVEIRNPRISIRNFNDVSESYRPVVTSPYSLTLSDHSKILAYGGDSFSFTRLRNIPTKPVAGFVPLRDIHNEGENMKERFVDILGAVRTVGGVRDIRTKTGQEVQLREIVLFDHTSTALKITVWNTDTIMRATSWIPRSTILFITDTRVEWSNFLRTYSASLTNRSIVTENPVGIEAAALLNYAKTVPLDTSAILDQLITDLPNPEAIQNVMCVQKVCNKMHKVLKEGSAEQQITALMYVFVSKLDLDGQSPTMSVKCSKCKSILTNMTSSCENPECSIAFGNISTEPTVSFDLKLNLSDHTGTLTNCRLFGTTAEQVLNCTIQQFLRMTDEQKCTLKWKFLLERCKVRIAAQLLNRRTPVISIVSCSKPNATEITQKIPTY